MRIRFKGCWVRATAARWTLGLMVGSGAVALKAQPVYPEIQSMVVLGDGYSDGGRLSGFVATNDPGLVWVDYLAVALGVPEAIPYNPVSQLDGKNYAIDLAFAGEPPQPFLPSGRTQIDEYFASLEGGAPPSDALHVLWLGLNDLLRAEAAPEDAADAILVHLQRLADAGARYFLIPDMIPLGMTPEKLDEAATFNARAAAFNNRLDQHLATVAGAYPEARFIKARVHALFRAIEANPAFYGFQNITVAAFLPGTTFDPNTYLWWTTKFPTTGAHAQIAEFAAGEIAAALGEANAAGLTLELSFAPDQWSLSVRGPPLGTLEIEMSSDGVTWIPLQTFTPFTGLEAVTLEGDAVGSPRLYRAR